MISNLDLRQITLKYQDEIYVAVKRVIDSGWYLQGKENIEFEKNYAEYIGCDYCIGVGNGLDALRLILRAYIELGQLNEGDEIIVPANTYIATILAITDNRLKPVLVEPDIDTYQIDSTKIEKVITTKTKAIMLVHLYGRCAYTPLIGNLCKKYNLKLFEDNAQAHGCLFQGIKTGALGDAAAHSFYPTKNIGALGDAGAITTNDLEVAKVVRILANYGSGEKYIFDYQGINSRLDEVQAAVLKIKLSHIDDCNEYRRQVARRYIQNINHEHVLLPKVDDWLAHVFHIFTVRSDYRDLLQKYLLKNEIQTVIHYPIPPHKQKCYSSWNNISLPITELIHREELSLPMSSMISFEDVDKIISTINAWEF